MILLNPTRPDLGRLDEPSRALILKTIDFFETKGKARLREDDMQRAWYADFLDFARREQLFATFLTPAAYGAQGARWDTCRNCALNEILGFYGLPYWYTWQVSDPRPRPDLDERERGGQAADRPACSPTAASSPSASPRRSTAPTSTRPT